MKRSNKKLISIVSAAYNEAESIPLLVRAVQGVFQGLAEYDFELWLVDDGSIDETWEKIMLEGQKDSRVKGLRLSRNFGQQAALTAGIDHANGEAVIYLDADLQHPPTLIPQLISRWEKGAKVVHTVRERTESLTIIQRFFSYLFYCIINFLSEVELREGMADFKLLDSSVVSVLRTVRERNRYLKSLIPWLGFTSAYVSYVAPARARGRSSRTFRKNFNLALTAILSFSTRPLKMIGLLGGALVLVSVGLIFGNLVRSFYIGDWYFSPIFSLLLFNTFLFGLTLICLGIVGLYIMHVRHEVVRRPIYLIEETFQDEQV